MESKHNGDSSATDYALEQALLSIYQSSVPKEQKTEKVLRLLAQYPSEKFTHHSMKHLDAEASTRTVLWYFILTCVILTSVSLLLLPDLNYRGSKDASILIRDGGKAVIIK